MNGSIGVCFMSSGLCFRCGARWWWFRSGGNDAVKLRCRQYPKTSSPSPSLVLVQKIIRTIADFAGATTDIKGSDVSAYKKNVLFRSNVVPEI
ncbi:hypothetical protein HanRHA438_Chr00c21g0852401 [Helianthus annuus]|nr:hypothetical protein HanRHA438_Chr00c21g0852401 [Helianthus annuus]